MDTADTAADILDDNVTIVKTVETVQAERDSLIGRNVLRLSTMF